MPPKKRPGARKTKGKVQTPKRRKATKKRTKKTGKGKAVRSGRAVKRAPRRRANPKAKRQPLQPVRPLSTPTQEIRFDDQVIVVPSSHGDSRIPRSSPIHLPSAPPPVPKRASPPKVQSSGVQPTSTGHKILTKSPHYPNNYPTPKPMPQPTTPVPQKIITKKLQPISYPWTPYLPLWTTPSEIVKPQDERWLQGEAKHAPFEPEKRKVPSVHLPDDMTELMESYWVSGFVPDGSNIPVYNGKAIVKWMDRRMMKEQAMPFVSAFHLAEVVSFANTTINTNRTAKMVVVDILEFPVEDWIFEHIHLVANTIIETTMKPKKMEWGEVKMPPNISVANMVLKLYKHWFQPISIMSSTGRYVTTYSSTGLQMIMHYMSRFNTGWHSELHRLEKVILALKF